MQLQNQPEERGWDQLALIGSNGVSALNTGCRAGTCLNQTELTQAAVQDPCKD